MINHLPEEAYTLAASYHLGTPQKCYTRRIRSFASNWLAVPILIICLISMVENFTSGTFFAPGTNVACIFMFLLAALLFIDIPGWIYYAYECSDGFVEINRVTHKATRSLRWDNVRSARFDLPTKATAWGNRHYVITIDHQRVEVPYRSIWRHCKEASRRFQQRQQDLTH